MKRNGIYSVFLIFITLLWALIAGAAPLSIVNSKHNLASTGTSSIKAKTPAQGGTDEICVFCHTPHGGNTQAPLWNKTASTASYATYTSDVLSSGLNYWAAEDPNNKAAAGYAMHVKTRICLSCHDGTIALGNLVNLPFGPGGKMLSDVQMQGGVTTMPVTAGGYLGIDLKDDHPVAIKHDTTKDPAELIIPSGNVYLYGTGVQPTKTNGDYVECTSCHNAHDNQYGNFLVDPNDGSKLCKSCHQKWIGASTGSAHDTATSTPYAPTSDGIKLGNFVSDIKCMTCHSPHKAGGTGSYQNITPNANTNFGKYLLSFPEEQSCYNNPNDRWNTAGASSACHGSGGTKHIQDLVAGTKASRHQVDKNTSPIHEATEAQTVGWLTAGNAKWHIECADCHNPHTDGNVSHTASIPVPVVPPAPTTQIGTSSPLYGTGGVQVSGWPTFASPNSGTYAYLEPIGVVDKTKSATGVLYEYQICLKCHSEFAWRTTGGPPNSPSFSPAANMTDQAVEFNPNNANNYFHPVAGANTHGQGTLVGSWQTNKGNQTMYCSDCHNNNLAPPQGPHGSNNKFILSANFTDMYSARGGGDAAKQPSNDLCFICHDQNTYWPTSNLSTGGTGFTAPGGLNLHAMHAYRAVNPTIVGLNPWPYRCVNCHARVPHGFNRRAMIVLSSDATPYVATDAVLGGGKINSYTVNTGNYVIGNCTTANGCHVAGP